MVNSPAIDYKHFVNFTTDLLCTVNFEGCIQWFNGAFINHFGHTEKELFNKPIFNFLHAEDVQAAVSTMEETIRSGLAATNFIARFRCKDGTYRRLRWSGSLVRSENLLYGVATDITDVLEKVALEKEVKDRTRELKESRIAYETLYNNAPDMLCSVDPATRTLVKVNQAMVNKLGYAKSELIGKPVMEIYHPDYRNEVKADLQTFKRSGKVRNDNLVLLTKDGESISVELNATAIRDKNGVILFSSSVLRDASNRIKLEKSLQRKEKKFEIMASHSPVGIYQNDQSGACIYVNEAVSNIVGVPVGLCLGDGWGANIYEEDKESTFAAWTETVEKGIPFQKEYRFLHQDGTLKWSLGQANPILNDQGESIGFIGTLTDITELKKIQEELEQFIYSISHDLRAPVRHIEGFTGYILDDEAEKLTETGKGYFRKVIKSAKRLGSMIDDLLEYARNRNTTIVKNENDLTEIVNKAIGTFAPDTKRRKIKWKVSPLPKALVNEDMMILAFENLFSNAIKYTPKEKGPCIEIWSEETEKFITIFVRDNGVGFDMKYKDKLFTVFQRLHERSKFQGNGIGLANTKRIIENHGGTIRGTGEVDKGATFYFTLPKHN